jgi:hypothetical protein
MVRRRVIAAVFAPAVVHMRRVIAAVGARDAVELAVTRRRSAAAGAAGPAALRPHLRAGRGLALSRPRRAGRGTRAGCRKRRSWRPGRVAGGTEHARGVMRARWRWAMGGGVGWVEVAAKRCSLGASSGVRAASSKYCSNTR